MAEKSADLALGHFARMAFAMEKGKSPDPLAISFFGAPAVLHRSQNASHLAKPFWLGRWHVLLEKHH